MSFRWVAATEKLECMASLTETMATGKTSWSCCWKRVLQLKSEERQRNNWRN